MREYLYGLELLMDEGKVKENRTGINTRSIFGYQMYFDLREGFPAVTTKKLAWKSVVSELLWFLEGSNDERRLAEIHYEKPRNELIGKSTIWRANVEKQGRELGYPVDQVRGIVGRNYGTEWRDWNGVDQIAQLVHDLKNNPESRRHILNAWNVTNIPKMVLPPCHVMAQFDVTEGRLSCQVYQRSVDAFLGLPFNIASYALLTHILADNAGLEVGHLIHISGDFHLYENHINAVNEQLNKTPYLLPRLEIPSFDVTDIEVVKQQKLSDFKLVGYESHETIKAPMAV